MQFCSMLGIALPSESTVRRDFKASLDSLVYGPRAARLTALLTEHAVVINGMRYVFRPLLTGSADGWTKGGGESMQSLEVSGCILTTALGGVPARMVPDVIPAGLIRFSVGVDGTGGHDGQAHAELFVRTLAALTPSLRPSDMLGFVLDTTAVQHVWVERPEFATGGVTAPAAQGGARSGAVFAYCQAHVNSLLAKDLTASPAFTVIAEACMAASTWFMESEKRTAPLLAAQAIVTPAKPPVKPLRTVRTRFLYTLLSIHRMGRLCPALEHMRAPAKLATLWVGNPETRAAFVTHAAAVTALAPEIAMLDTMFGPLLELSPALGHESHYTSSLRVSFLMLQDAAITKTLLTASANVRAIAALYRQKLYERSAPVSYWATTAIPATSVEPTGAERLRRLHWGEQHNVSAYLDPATTSPLVFDAYGGSVGDAVTHCVLALKAAWLRPPAAAPVPAAAAVAAAGAAGAGPTLTARRTVAAAEIKLVKARVKPPFQQEASWKEQQEAAIHTVRIKYQLDLAGGDDVDAVGLEDAIHEAFLREAALYKAQRLAEFFTVAKFGAPVAQVHPVARYTYWPSQAGTLPLHYLCARIFLGSRATANANESFHSTASYIANKLRSAMKPETLEQVHKGTLRGALLLI